MMRVCPMICLQPLTDVNVIATARQPAGSSAT
eukprot:CAMPEP_0184394498 /NCGR_PEP_ID=MMETSP0007-20130409/39811_1 /TAXON_ID=97485 /ORGANISM="Prymnesium parvum, Strain Texoma1" /LENGTH=31 /DNA_ID= /DNA_START= /DNA_END= /DNA_ORIENTATION=